MPFYFSVMPSINVWAICRSISNAKVYRWNLPAGRQDFNSCKEYRIEVQVAVYSPQDESFCSLCHWLSSSVPVAVALCLFIGYLVWKNN
jgi:hypothetical protein